MQAVYTGNKTTVRERMLGRRRSARINKYSGISARMRKAAQALGVLLHTHHADNFYTKLT